METLIKTNKRTTGQCYLDQAKLSVTILETNMQILVGTMFSDLTPDRLLSMIVGK